MKTELYWSKLFQFGEDVEEIDKVLESMSLHDAVAYLGDYYDYGQSTENDFTPYKPYCANNGTDIGIGSSNGYTLLYNCTLGGVYLLYRKARPEEVEWWNDRVAKSQNSELYIHANN